MSFSIRLRKVDLEILAAIDSDVTNSLSAKQSRAWVGFYERVLAAEMKPRKAKPKASINVNDAVTVFRGVLGKRLVMPAGEPGAGWYAQLQNRISASGLTPVLCERAATVAALEWKGPIKAESIIRQADVLLSEAMAERHDLAPPEIDDMQEL